jgi:hypothetical protein
VLMELIEPLQLVEMMELPRLDGAEEGAAG